MILTVHDGLLAYAAIGISASSLNMAQLLLLICGKRIGITNRKQKIFEDFQRTVEEMRGELPDWASGIVLAFSFTVWWAFNAAFWPYGLLKRLNRPTAG